MATASAISLVRFGVERQVDYEAAPTRGRELRGELAAVQLHDLAAEIEAQSEPRAVLLDDPLVEAVEDVGTVLWRYPGPEVPHGHGAVIIEIYGQRDVDRGRGGTVLERVVQQ